VADSGTKKKKKNFKNIVLEGSFGDKRGESFLGETNYLQEKRKDPITTGGEGWSEGTRLSGDTASRGGEGKMFYYEQ